MDTYFNFFVIFYLPMFTKIYIYRVQKTRGFRMGFRRVSLFGVKQENFMCQD